MRKWGTVALGFVLAMSIAAPAHASSGQRHRYVANDFYSYPFAALSQRTGVAADGTVMFQAPADHVVVTIADQVEKRSVPLFVNTTDGWRVQCVRSGHAARVAGLVRGEWVGLTVLDETYHGPCNAGATLGVITIHA